MAHSRFSVCGTGFVPGAASSGGSAAPRVRSSYLPAPSKRRGFASPITCGSRVSSAESEPDAMSMPSTSGVTDSRATDSRATTWLARRLHAWARVAPAHWVAFLVFAILALEPVRGAAVNGRRTAILVWIVAVVLAYLWRSRPVMIAAVIVVASAALRLHFLGIGFADQITVSQSAWGWVIAGGNPYGIGYESTIPPGAPFPYGPLGLVWWLPGPIIEFAAAIAIMLLLAWRRAWLTLAVMAGWHQSIHLTFV